VRLRALAIVVVVLTLAACTSSETGPTTTTTAPASTEPLPAVDLSATPDGWVPVDYGDAQVSVPPTWWVSYGGSGCGTTPPGLLVVQPPEGPAWCGAVGFETPAQRPAPPKSIVTVGPELGTYHLPAGPSVVIHGIALYVLSRGARVTTIRYLAQDLRVIITTSGPLGRRVLDTLSLSPRAAVLSEGALRTPRTWRWHAFDGVRFATPATWPVQRTDMFSSCRSFVALGGRQVVRYSSRNVVIEPDRPVVDLDTDRTAYTGSCPPGPFQEYAPGNGVQVDAGSAQVPTPSPSRLDTAIRLNGVVAYVNASQPFDILDLLVVVPGRAMPLDVEIGLAGHGMVTRTILYSLRAA
jgi:hypothetical protein